MKTRTSILGETGDLAAPPGSREWAIAVRHELASCLHEAEFSSEQARRYFDAMRRHEGWKQLEARGGRRFMSFEEFCIAKQPQGLGYEIAAIEQIIRERKQAEIAAAKEAGPSGDHGGDRRSEKAKGDQGSIGTLKRGNITTYLARRLLRDRPDLFERLEAGEFSSVRAAALEAGIVKPTFTCPIEPERAARLIRKHFDAESIGKIRDLLSEG